LEEPILAEPRIGLVGRLLAHRAGVEQDQVGLGHLAGRQNSLLHEQAGHPLRVQLVHLAAPGLDEDPARRRADLPTHGPVGLGSSSGSSDSPGSVLSTTGVGSSSAPSRSQPGRAPARRPSSRNRSTSPGPASERRRASANSARTRSHWGLSWASRTYGSAAA